jgi:FeS assembly SUF system protein
MSKAMDTSNLGDKIVGVLKTIFDPEIPVDIYELGLIYDVFVNEESDVKILMTLTTPNCPVAESLPMEVEEKVKSLNEVKTAEVEITFDPPWTQELMSEEAKLELVLIWRTGWRKVLSLEKNRLELYSKNTIGPNTRINTSLCIVLRMLFYPLGPLF